MAEPILALSSGESQSDPKLAVYGVQTLAVALVVAFGALFAAWLSLRSGTAVWPPKGVTIENYYGTTLSLTVLIMAATAEWGAFGVRRGERAQAIAGWVLTLVLGLGFLNLWSYVASVQHFGPGTHAYGALWFAFAVLMGLSVVAGLVTTLVALARTLGNQVSEYQPALARSTAWLWHAIAVGWLIVYTAEYVVK